MKLLFKSREPEAISMHELARARSEFVFRRLAWLISRATVSLSDINGPRGGVDKRCQVELQVNREHKVVATSIARDWRGAIDLALARAVRTLVRKRQSVRPARRVRARSHAFKGSADAALQEMPQARASTAAA
ncbi:MULTISPECIES: HPF/RaiA family ribosome-associated protein [unclassified Caballeronia]|uniref:HPF/RaiA family ribosome-associated protein n=1 Tax=unclassified Caballeronia TaxID=2646786 RepID=UPI00285E15AF|nr:MULTISPECIES: HPF/RaiA family ribosome-associated protein [unclassified Caballeronia]MDR5739510.1 HPF/RaiA family ribosome-associated protein [Caballeronia sp. LZ016]MDR5807978.1 HPF/RaiA family ribosome-associated protein [Caballeronia sp. LZ019]